MESAGAGSRGVRAAVSGGGRSAGSGGPLTQYVVSLIAAGPDETVPEGVPLELVRLPSVETEEVKSWVAQHRTDAVFVVTGVDIASQGTPSLPVNVTEDEYVAVAAAMPR